MPLLSLALPPRALEGGCLCILWVTWVAGTAATVVEGGVERAGSWVSQPYPSWSGLQGPPAWQGDHNWELLPWLDREGPQASQPLLPGTLWSQASPWPVSHSHVCYYSCYCEVLQGCRHSFHSQEAGTVEHHLHSLRSHLSIVPVHPPSDVQTCRSLQCPAVLDIGLLSYGHFKDGKHLYITILYKNMEC